MHFKCDTTNECIPFLFFENGMCHCSTYDNDLCDDEGFNFYDKLSKMDFLFLLTCNNITNLPPIEIDGKNYTDETECDRWPCNTIYTRCDNYWNCLDGADEVDCDHQPRLLNCSLNNHVCLSSQTGKLICLPIEKANDGNVDCIGAMDEPKLCRADEYKNPFEVFYCNNNSSSSCLPIKYICDRKSDCINEEDEQNCMNMYTDASMDDRGICTRLDRPNSPIIAKAVCPVFSPQERRSREPRFQFNEDHNNLPIKDIIQSKRQFDIKPVQFYQQRCHRGLDVQIWLNKGMNLTRNVCLCPPSFYGDQCQYQNQRVSLTIRFRAASDLKQIPFAIIFSLIDDSNERIIHSYESITYLSYENCFRKYHFYLVYSKRGKDQTKKYSIHIDFYDKQSLIYQTSIIKPLQFSFLPVHRLSFILNIPRANIDQCVDRQCIHGQCRRYSNDSNNTTFCQCNPGWSGQYCTIPYNCTCSADSLCIGLLANNRSLCVCPLDKMGDRCLLNNTACQSDQQNPCLNGGQCIVTNSYRITDKDFSCICPKNVRGARCELSQAKLIITFDKNIDVPSSIHIHLMHITSVVPHERSTIFKMIPFGQSSVTIYWPFAFHIVFIEWNKNYYLTILQSRFTESAVIEKTLHPSDRCLNISELLTEPIINYHYIRRIKYYHIPCQTNLSLRLSCFYDDTLMCLCENYHGQRIANCFNFDHNMNMNCFDNSGCENGGSCYEENVLCPKTSFCACPVCFYGSRCQMSTHGFSLSLDAILGYHIRPNIGLKHQSTAVLVSLVLSIIIVFGGLTNGIVSLITFKNRKARDAGCGVIYFGHR